MEIPFEGRVPSRGVVTLWQRIRGSDVLIAMGKDSGEGDEDVATPSKP